MIELLLKILVGFAVLVAVEIGYNAVVFHQISKTRWPKFILISLFALLVGISAWYGIDQLYLIPYLGTVVSKIDDFINLFISYIPLHPVLIWFLAPIGLAFLFFSIKAVFNYYAQRRIYRKWEAAQTAKEKQDIPQIEAEDKKIETVQVETDTEMTDTAHFLNRETVNIRYKSVLGIQRAYEIARTRGLQLAENDDGYIAVYADSKGLQDLKVLLSENSIDISELQKRPSVVFFDKFQAHCVGIKDQLRQLQEAKARG